MNVFNTNINIEIGLGLLNTTKKASQPKGPVTNLRPITLLPTK